MLGDAVRQAKITIGVGDGIDTASLRSLLISVSRHTGWGLVEITSLSVPRLLWWAEGIAND